MTIDVAQARPEAAPLRVHVAGGSLGGLMAGLELRSAGCDVRISERSDRVMDDRGAGIGMQAETLHQLKKHGLADERTAGVWSHHRQFLGRDGEAASLSPSSQLMTSWGLLYRRCRSAFPESNYHEGRAVVGFEQDENEVRITLSDRCIDRCGLLVGADGARSLCRKPRSRKRLWLIGIVTWSTTP
jgi:2,6-dihydroxypyridine 3-monooxygenase